MKFSQAELTKLALGAGVGYLGASFLIPHHRGFAAGGHCNDCGSGAGDNYNHWVECCRTRSSSCPCPGITTIDQGTKLVEKTYKPPSWKPDVGSRGHVYQPFTPEFITGQTPSTGPISSGICKMINLPGCDTVVDPNTGKSVKAGCPFMGMNFPVDCWVLAAAGVLILVLALK